MTEKERPAAVTPQVTGSKLEGLDLMFEENFEDDNTGQRWEFSDGCNINISNGQAQFQGNGWMVASASCGRGYTLEAKVVPQNNRGGQFGIIFLQNDKDNYYVFQYNYNPPPPLGQIPILPNSWYIVKYRNGAAKVIGGVTSEILQAEEQLLKVEVSYNEFGQTVIKGYNKGAIKCEATDIGQKRGKVPQPFTLQGFFMHFEFLGLMISTLMYQKAILFY